MKFGRAALLAIPAYIILANCIAMAGQREAGFGSRSAAMGQAQSAVANDSSAVMYNPACLVLARERWSMIGRGLWVQVGQSGYNSHLRLDGVDQDYRYVAYRSIGLIIPLGKRITSAVNIALANDSVLTTIINSGPRFVRYAPNEDPYVNFAFSLKLTKRFSLGYAQLLSLNANSSVINIDINSLAADLGFPIGEPAVNINPNIELDVTPGMGYNIGALYRPANWLSLGFNYGYRYSTKIYIPVRIPGGAFPELNIVIDGYNKMAPTTLTFGAGFFPTKHLTIAIDLAYEKWSRTNQWWRFRSSIPGLWDKPFPKVKLNDIILPKIGLEYRSKFRGRLERSEYAVRTGYLFYKSPWPQWAQGTRDIDSDAHHLSIGGSLGYHPRHGVKYLGVDYFFEYISLVERDHKDISTNPSTMVSDGYVTYSGFALTIQR